MCQLYQQKHGAAPLNLSRGGVQRIGVSDQRNSAGLAARIELYAKRLQLRVRLTAINESNDHRQEPMNAGTAPLEQQPGSLFSARHQRLAAFV
jgi:hypothetical protein